MKNRLLLSISATAVLLAISGVSLIPEKTLAQETSLENELLAKIDALVEQLANLASSSETEGNAPISTQLQMINSGAINPMCLDNYETWPSSTTFNPDAPWSIHGFWSWGNSNYAPYYENMTDVNGDGLVDYIYRHSYASNVSGIRFNSGESCVLLNNGSGWDVAFRCFIGWDSTSSQPLFMGDCAQL